MAHFRRAVGAAVIVCLFALSAVHATGGRPQTCAARCPVDCPMHVKKLHCHGGASASASHAGCHQKDNVLPGFQSAGCQHHGSDATTPDELAVLFTSSKNVARLPQPASLPSARPRLANVTLDPPFRPPTSLARLSSIGA